MRPRERHPGCQRRRLLVRAPRTGHRPPQLRYDALELGGRPLEPGRRRFIQTALDVRRAGDANAPRRALERRAKQLPLERVRPDVIVADGGRIDDAPHHEREAAYRPALAPIPREQLREGAPRDALDDAAQASLKRRPLAPTGAHHGVIWLASW